MANPASTNKLKETIEKKLAAMLKADEPPTDAEMKLMTLGIKYLAVQAKLEESEYGDFFNDGPDGDPGGIQAEPDGAEPPRRRRKANGAGADDGAAGARLDGEGQGLTDDPR